VGLASGVDFKADVKPVSRAYMAQSLLSRSTLCRTLEPLAPFPAP
jgi:hypothetical protein